MTSVHDYKRLENKLVQKVKNAAIVFASFVVSAVQAIGRFLTRRYTLVFVPHSEKKVYNFHVTVLSICCFLLVVFGILGAFFWYGSSYSSTMYAMASTRAVATNSQASLDQFRDETDLMLREARNFQKALSEVLSTLGLDDNNSMSQATAGDLNSFLGIRETQEGLLREVDDVRRLSAYLSQAVIPIREIGTLLDSQSVLLAEIPSLWPIKGGLGTITMFFGNNVHPLTGQYYVHKGIDISNHRAGDPIVATADGQVVTVEYTHDFGNYVIIRHKHGYYTRYAHMQSFRVMAGQRVQQGEVIGYVGNTGVSTGPHVHYEVHIGSDVVDPYKYINIRSRMAKQSPDRRSE